MRSVSVRLCDLYKAVIPLGFMGENEHTRVRFDCMKLFGEYPEAVQSLTVQPPMGVAYPAVTVRDGDYVIWDVTDSDLAEDGNGEIQLTFTVDGVVAKSYIAKTKISRSLEPAGDVPEPIDDWITRANTALAEIPETVEASVSEAMAEAEGRIEGDIADAEAWAKGTRDGEPVASDDPAYHNNSKYYSEQAAVSGAEQVALVEAAGAAQLGAVNAAGTTQVGNVNTAGTTQVGNVNTAGATQVAAIEDKGEETLESIPSDYTNLSNEVGELKSAIDSMDGGTTGQVLRKKSNADYDVEWAGVAQPTDAQVAEAVDDWLEDHPEATTTVQDASLTEAKFTAQTILDYKNYVVTPQMYGAKADGTTDDTTAIQNALNAHKKVYFPQGNYKITEPLVLKCGHTVEGDSKYNACIWAYGCDCFRLTSGDQGERGTISRIHLRGNSTAGTCGVKLSGGAPDWDITDVWINSFDYGIYGYRVGNVNNIYITRCIIIGNPQHWMTAGIYMPNGTNQINICVIRECEINMCDMGIVIGGTVNSILQNTIQTCNFAIVCDADIDGGSVRALTINGNYTEGVKKSAIYFNTRSSETNHTRGYFNGVQITNNYLMKNNENNDWAVIKFVSGDTHNAGIYNNCSTYFGGDYTGIFIGMNDISCNSNCKPYDVENSLGIDSLFMASDAGSGNTSILKLQPKYTSAHMIGRGISRKDVTSARTYPYYINSKAELIDDKTVVLHRDGVFIVYINGQGLNEISYKVKADEYPCNIEQFAGVRSGEDGRLYRNFNNTTGFAGDIEDKVWDGDSAASSELKESSVGEDQYIKLTPFQEPYHRSSARTWHTYSGFALVIHNRNKDGQPDITVKFPTLKWTILI